MKAKDRPKMNWWVLLRRYLAKETLFKYEEDYLRTFLRDKADTVFSKFIRDRDKIVYVYLIELLDVNDL